MLTQKIRREFLNYFRERDHAIVASSSVVPHDDPTLLFTNAGMNQFKDVFLQKTRRDYTKAATSQKCIRVGGKHNDLENVGHTSRHLTFFEMIGNFSFGDYFKKEAIEYAWEVATTIFGFDPHLIWPSVFREDDEAFELWTKYVPRDRITRMNEKDNFWMMGDTGPCGPCSELYFDRGPKYGQAKNPAEDIEGNRFIEFWNLVFMQFNTANSGVREVLPKPSIDTGSGLERVVALKMGVDSVFETDILRKIIAKIESASSISYQYNSSNASAFRVIADHLRCLSFAIVDGAQPSNEGRGYVLRKVLRRAVRYGKQLGFERPFLAEILPTLVTEMGEDYPELVKGKERITELLTTEEENFIRTLKRGGALLKDVIDRAQKTSGMITGEDAFKLKDTYGLPCEEILLIAKDANLTVDEKCYTALETEARERSRQRQKQVSQVVEENQFSTFAQEHGTTHFIGYDAVEGKTHVVGIVKEGTFVDSLHAGDEALIFLASTPFYAEMGGQVGDSGLITHQDMQFTVKTCTTPFKGLVAHGGKLERGSLHLNEDVYVAIDKDKRKKIENNHTATHLLHFVLGRLLGEHIKQAGSIVEPHKLRFDFSHHKALSLEEIRQIEDQVNALIRENRKVSSYELSYDEVQKREDIKQFFGEKYGQSVRVIDIENSKELCGGTHASSTGNIGYFRILKEGSIAAGIRRIEAVTGHEAEEFSRTNEDMLHQLATVFKITPHQLYERVEKMLEENKHLTQEIKNLKLKDLKSLVLKLISEATQKNDVSIVIQEVFLSPEEMRECCDLVLEKLPNGLVFLGTKLEDKCQFIVKASDSAIKKGFSAVDLLKSILGMVEGSGGGKPQMAQGGGKNKEKLHEALNAVREKFN